MADPGSEAGALQESHGSDLVERDDDGTVLIALAEERDEAIRAHRRGAVCAVVAVDPEHPGWRRHGARRARVSGTRATSTRATGTRASGTGDSGARDGGQLVVGHVGDRTEPV